MTNLQRAIQTVQQLSPAEQIELIKQVFENLLLQPLERVKLFENALKLVDDPSSNQQPLTSFWHPKPLPQHIAEQNVTPITDLDTLAMQSWPETETADDFIAFTYQQRQTAQDRYDG